MAQALESLLDLLKESIAPALARFWDSLLFWRFATLSLIILILCLFYFRDRIPVVWAFWKRLQDAASVPREALRILPSNQPPTWSAGTVDGDSAMQMNSRWFATNISNVPIRVLKARLGKPDVAGMVLTREADGNMFGSFEVLPGETTDLHADFWVVPPATEPGKSFTTDVIVQDQFGNEYALRNTCFQNLPLPNSTPAHRPPAESLASLTDQIERMVASILKDEAMRYQQCNRSSGGLGSTITRIAGQAFIGLGTEWRRANSPKPQLIIEDPAIATVSSDNADALVDVYNALATEDERTRFVAALLGRVHRGSEYALVGYLATLVMFRIGRLTEALESAKENLMGDSGHGFSDAMRMVDGLLRLQHDRFSDRALDDLESFAHGLDENRFQVIERINAIHALRVRRGTRSAPQS